MKVPRCLRHFQVKTYYYLKNTSDNTTEVTLGKIGKTNGTLIGFTITVGRNTSDVQSISNKTITVNGVNATNEIYTYTILLTTSSKT